MTGMKSSAAGYRYKKRQMRRAIFVTATDTNIGKTVMASAIALGLKERGIDCGVMKPVQCAGNDAAFLKKISRTRESLDVINPFYFKRPLSPHLASRLEKRRVSIKKIIRCYELLRKRHEFLIVEGAGGLLVPVTEKFLIADLIKKMNLEIVIVARAGLGTINHTLLTIEAAKSRGIGIVGVIFNQNSKGKITICEKDNPLIIYKRSRVRNLGFIPFLQMQQSYTSIKALSKITQLLDIESILNV